LRLVLDGPQAEAERSKEKVFRRRADRVSLVLHARAGDTRATEELKVRAEREGRLSLELARDDEAEVREHRLAVIKGEAVARESRRDVADRANGDRVLVLDVENEAVLAARRNLDGIDERRVGDERSDALSGDADDVERGVAIDIRDDSERASRGARVRARRLEREDRIRASDVDVDRAIRARHHEVGRAEIIAVEIRREDEGALRGNVRERERLGRDRFEEKSGRGRAGLDLIPSGLTVL